MVIFEVMTDTHTDTHTDSKSTYRLGPSGRIGRVKTLVHINFFVPHVFCENGPPPVSTFLWALMFTRHLCMYSLGQWSDQRYYVINHVLSDLRGQPLPKFGGIFPISLMLIWDAVDGFAICFYKE